MLNITVASFVFCMGIKNNNSICHEITSTCAYLCFTFPDSIIATENFTQRTFEGLCTSEGNLVVEIYDAQISVV